LFCLEEIDPDELKSEGGQLVQCVFFTQGDHYNEFKDEPFYFYFLKGEKLSEAKKRLIVKLGVDKSEFSGARFARVRKFETYEIKDDQVVADIPFSSRFNSAYFGICQRVRHDLVIGKSPEKKKSRDKQKK